MVVSDDALIGRMITMVDSWEECGDSRCIFLRCYSMMTSNIINAVATHRFYDPVWVERLMRHFATYYFEALEAYDAGHSDVPAIWKRTHDLARSLDTTVMEDLLLGINAHINHDLVLAVADMLYDEWPSLTAEQRELRFQDHMLVNEVIAETIDAVQNELGERYARLLAVFDAVCGPLDEWKTSEYITTWRRDVWHHAVRLVEAPPLERSTVRAEIAAAALERTTVIFVGGELRARVFGYPVRWLRRLKLL